MYIDMAGMIIPCYDAMCNIELQSLNYAICLQQAGHALTAILYTECCIQTGVAQYACAADTPIANKGLKSSLAASASVPISRDASLTTTVLFSALSA